MRPGVKASSGKKNPKYTGTAKSPATPSNGNGGKTDGLGRADLKPGQGTVITHNNGDFSAGKK